MCSFYVDSFSFSLSISRHPPTHAHLGPQGEPPLGLELEAGGSFFPRVDRPERQQWQALTSPERADSDAVSIPVRSQPEDQGNYEGDVALTHALGFDSVKIDSSDPSPPVHFAYFRIPCRTVRAY